MTNCLVPKKVLDLLIFYFFPHGANGIKDIALVSLIKKPFILYHTLPFFLTAAFLSRPFQFAHSQCDRQCDNGESDHSSLGNRVSGSKLKTDRM